MRNLLAEYNTFTAQIIAAHGTIDSKVKELNELTEELIDLLRPTMAEVHAFDNENEATMKPLVADLRRLIDEREELAQRIYDYEVARRLFLHQPPLESEPNGGRPEGERKDIALYLDRLIVKREAQMDEIVELVPVPLMLMRGVLRDTYERMLARDLYILVRSRNFHFSSHLHILMSEDMTVSRFIRQLSTKLSWRGTGS